jgi:hypothetical protein
VAGAGVLGHIVNGGTVEGLKNSNSENSFSNTANESNAIFKKSPAGGSVGLVQRSDRQSYS